MKNEQLNALLYEALETEMGGVQIYQTAIECVINEDLKEEWEEYLEQTQNHERIMLELMEKMGLNPDLETPGREVVRHLGESLVQAMEMAKSSGKPEAAQLVAAECVVLAETKDHANWELIGMCAEKLKGPQGHLYHTKGWTRELWIDFLGMPAVLPPPEEEKDVKTAIGAARAEQSRKDML